MEPISGMAGNAHPEWAVFLVVSPARSIEACWTRAFRQETMCRDYWDEVIKDGEYTGRSVRQIGERI